MGFFVNKTTDHVDGADWNDKHIACCPGCGTAAVPVDPHKRWGSWKHVSKPLTCREDDEFPSMCYFVEFGLMYNDHTWDTKIIELPMKYCHDDCTNEDRVEWARAVLLSYPFYENVVQFTVFNDNPYNGY